MKNSVPSHYLKYSRNVREHAIKVDSTVTDWASDITRDITENGTTLVIEALPPSNHGERLGLCGDKYYCEAARDRDRNDCLFIYWVEDAHRRSPKSVPRRYPVRISQLESRFAPPRDATTALWVHSTGQNHLEVSAVAIALDLSPSPPLLKTLGAVPAEVRNLWLPRDDSANHHEIWLDILRQGWAKFQLHKFVTTSARQEAILKGLVPESKLENSERIQILDLFDIGFFNAYVRGKVGLEPVLIELLCWMAPMPIPEAIRARIWAVMATSLERDGFLRELKGLVAMFEGPNLHQDVRTEWGAALLQLLERRLRISDDAVLRELFDQCRDDSAPLAALSRWLSETLTFSKLPPAPESDNTASSVAAEVQTVSESGSALENDIEQLEREMIGGPDDVLLRKWVLSLQGSDPDQVDQLMKEISSAVEKIAAITSGGEVLTHLPSLSDQLNQLHQQSQSWCQRLPDYQRYVLDTKEATEAYKRAYSFIGLRINEILSSTSVTPSDLNEAATLLARPDMIEALPSWVWPEASRSDASPHSTDFFSQLILPQVREKVISILSAAGELGPYEPAIIRLIPPPPNSPDEDGNMSALDQHVQMWLSSLRELLNELPTDVASALSRSPAKSTELILRHAVGIARKLQGRVSIETRNAIIREIATAPTDQAAIVAVGLYEEAISFCEQHFGTATDATFAQLKSRVEKASHLASFSIEVLPSGLDVEIDHNWIDGHGGKVALLFSPTSDQNARPYGYVSVPLVLLAKQRKQCSLKLQFEIKTGHREVWPREWEDPEPAELLVSDEAWRDDPEKPDQYVYTFRARIPMRRQGRGERFEFNITATNAESGRVCGPFRFVWDVINDGPPVPIGPTWPETVDLSNVVKHPVGPQRNSAQLLSRLKNGGSFSVTAPRRFGKSTLVQFLQSKAREEGFVVPDPVICTSYYAGTQGLDYEKLWQDVSDRLQNELGTSMSRAGGVPIPIEAAFDHVKRAAAKSGKKGIVLLFDEAQLFFSARTNISMGDLLKDRLERHWSRSEGAMVPVVFGFIGLPSLQARAGANLNGLLRPIAHNELQEDELNKLILAVTNGSLQTTREARQRLARTAGNVYILRTLVDELFRHIQGDGRSWANFDDVIGVEAALRAMLRDGREPVVSSYIRDILNDAEDVNLWRPNPAIPLAIAIAESRRKRVPAGRLLDDARIKITSWFEGLPPGDVTRLAYDSQQFEEHIRTLEERSVIRNREFTSCLLEDWLIGLHKTMDESAWRDLLVSSAMKRIKIPSVLKKVTDAEGGEATVRISITEGEVSAYRVTKLRSSDDKMRFAETREVLERLKQKLDDGELGARYVFRIREVGISADDDAEAVQVYRWVDGADLSRRIGELSSAYVAELGTKLAEALRFIHGLNILHRDLSPRNIVISEEGCDPVIIDFGFARRISDTMKTTVDSEFAAPEVRGTTARWTKAADVFSLGATLAKVLNRGADSTVLIKIIDACVSDVPEKRPDATQLSAMFEEAKIELHVESRKEAAWKKVQSACSSEFAASPWLRDVVEKFHGNFVSVALGCLPHQYDRSREVANLLNQVLEAFSSWRRMPDKLVLGKVKDENPQTGKSASSEAVRFMHSLRIYHSHGSVRSKTKLNLTDEQMFDYCITAASQIGSIVRVDGLEKLVELLAVGHDQR